MLAHMKVGCILARSREVGVKVPLTDRAMNVFAVIAIDKLVQLGEIPAISGIDALAPADAPS